MLKKKEITAMYRVGVFFFLLVFSLSSEAQVFRHIDEDFDQEYSLEEARRLSALMSCEIEENFDSYINHLVDVILPRIEFELPFLLRPHISLKGERVQVAEAVDAGDLFHVHVRQPLKDQTNQSSSFKDYTDPDQYHLQYHSFERSSVIKEKWMSELQELQDPILAQWLNDLIEHNKIVNSMEDPAFSVGYTPLETPIKEPLTELQKDQFSLLLFEHLNQGVATSEEYKAWLLARLKTRFNFLDPKTIAFNNLYSESRSVASTGYEFLILPVTAVPDYHQFANIYFEDRKDMPSEFEELIREAELEGASHIVKSDDLFSRALEISSSASDDLNVLKYAYSSETSASKHGLVAWTDNYVFSVSFSLTCGN